MWLYSDMLDLNWEIQYMNSIQSQTLHLLRYWDQSLDALARTNRNSASDRKRASQSNRRQRREHAGVAVGGEIGNVVAHRRRGGDP